VFKRNREIIFASFRLAGGSILVEVSGDPQPAGSSGAVARGEAIAGSLPQSRNTLRAPERIDRLVLVDSAGMGNDIPGGLLSYLTMRLPRLDELRWTFMVGNRTLTRRILGTALVNCNQVLTEEIEIIPRCGHLPPVENRGLFNQIVEDFLLGQRS
jgi:pimeloyl-ACP methyl ester carboxylesterase